MPPADSALCSVQKLEKHNQKMIEILTREESFHAELIKEAAPCFVPLYLSSKAPSCIIAGCQLDDVCITPIEAIMGNCIFTSSLLDLFDIAIVFDISHLCIAILNVSSP
jgi:hypothetical protein